MTERDERLAGHPPDADGRPVEPAGGPAGEPAGEPAGAGAEETPHARVHPLEWSPWIWILPLAALLAVGWFVVRYTVFGGGEVTVRFVEARGLERYSPVRYRGAKVGTVQEIQIDEALEEVVVRISMDARMGEALRTGTRFWIVEPGLESGLGSLLTGTHVAIAPGDGETTREFQGQEHPPILAAPEPGRIFRLETPALGQASVGSPVHFRGLRVGRVLGARYDHQRGVTEVHVFVIEPYAVYVRESTRFWRAGGLSLGFEGGRVSMDGSIGGMLTPALSFYTPEILAGQPAPEGARFELHDSQAAAMAAADGPHLDYRVDFPGPLAGLAAGTPVEMRGVRVGRVREVRLRYAAATASLETPVTLVIDPRRLELELPAGTTRDELRARMNDALQALVRNGLRARLATSLVLPGASAVSLDLVGTPGTARLDLSTDPPGIPAAAGGDGLQGALASVERLATTLEELPLRQIAGDLQSAARRVDALVNDPRLDSSLERLDSALVDVQGTAASARAQVEPIAESLRNAATAVESAAVTIDAAAGAAGANVEPIAASLRRAAASAESAAAGAEQLLGAAPRQSYDLAALVEELTRAAEAVRALASYLNENPDALLKGRAP